jgi:hypothetical protein
MSLMKKSRNRLLTCAAQNHLHRFCRVLPSRAREGAYPALRYNDRP